MFKSLIKFIKEARSELSKVSWPTKEQIWDSTKVVIVSVVTIAIFLGVLDLLFSRFIQWVMK